MSDTKIGTITVHDIAGALAWCGPMAIDADGAPTCYAPPPLVGLDHLANAGHPGNFWGIVCGPDGAPIVQGPADPAPGFYISTTALVDPSKAVGDPLRYVDSSTIPYLSVPPELLHLGVHKGDLAAATYRGAVAFAIVADVGPRAKLGEASPALAEQLGIPASPRDGGCSGGVRYVVFRGSLSAPPWPRSSSSISADGSVLLEVWGGAGRLSAIS